MEINIGIRGSANPIALEVAMSTEEITALVENTITSNNPLKLESTDGNLIVIPADALGYVRIAKEEQRRVGFGFI